MKNRAESIHLHTGGVPTGAEDAVVFLAANRAGLRRAGIDLFAFDPMAGGEDSIAAYMPAPAAQDDAFSNASERLGERLDAGRSRPSPRFLISACELAGPVPELLSGRFHAQARQRARTLARALGQRVDRLVMSIQPYDQLYHSVWMMQALDRRMEPFAEYAAPLGAMLGGWADLARIWREELQVGELVVLAEPMTPPQLLSQLVPGLVLRQPVMPRPRPRVTPSAVAMAQRCLAQGTRLQPGQRDRLVEFHARQPQVQAVGAYPADVRATLGARYEDDLHQLIRMDCVTLVGGLMPAMAAE